MREIQPLKYNILPEFLSEKQLAEHHDVLYVGYVNKLNEIEERLASVDKTKANATFSDFRALKKEEVFAQNGILLHELYFENITNNADSRGNFPELFKKIETDFGSFDAWQADFIACGMSSRGWVILGYNPEDQKLHNYIADVHDVGGVWNAKVILVLDVYEHAYFIDYATKKKNYIEAFVENINWEAAGKRL